MKKLLIFSLVILILKLFINDAKAQMFWNQACRFNQGIDTAHISIPHSPSLNITGSFTIEAWVNPTNVASPGSQIILQKRAGANNNGYTLYLSSGKVSIRTNSTNRLIGKTIIPNNQWTHIAGTYDSITNVFRTYINGLLDTSVAVPAADPAANTDSLFIGKGFNGPFAGQMDEVRVWIRSLSATEINQYRRTSLGTGGGKYNRLVLSMTFQDNESESTESIFVLTDWSVSSNNGFKRGVTEVDLNNRPSTTISPNESAELDGNDDYLAGPDNPNVSPTTALTLEAWICPRDTNVANKTIIHKGTPNVGTTNYRLRLDSNKVKATINGNTGFVSNSTIPANQWTHVAFTYNGGSGEYKFYVNGNLINSNTNAPVNIINGSDSLYIGGTPGLPDFNGFIDEVRISNYVKSQLHINKYLYQSIDSANVPNLAGTNVVYNLDGYSVDNAEAGPRLYFRNNASFSHPATNDNQPVSPLNRSDVLNFQDGFYLKTSGKLIGPTVIIYDTLDLFYDTVVHDINLFVSLNHDDESDLEISLISPDGVEVKVLDNNTLDGRSDNVITIFNDQADSSLVNGRYVSFAPSIKPATINGLSSFNGDTLLGKWILKINDQSGPASGRLYAWGLQVNNMPFKVACLNLKFILQGWFTPLVSFDNMSAQQDYVSLCIWASFPPPPIVLEK